LTLFGTALAAAAERQKASSAPMARKSLSDNFEGMELRNIGPFRGGRSVAVTGVRKQPLTFYFGGTGGGVWKTVDAGGHWDPVSDKDFRTGSVGAICVSESDPNVVYVGTGESPIRGNLSYGDGVYRSTDAGRSWKNMGLSDTHQISRVRVHPEDPDLVYVAALGHAWGPNAERGIFRTSDGGRTWKNVLFVDDSTGASDLAMDPGNPRILYAGFWSVVRRPWSLESGGPGSALYRSTDGGDSWKKLTEGLPEGIWGRVGVAVSPSRPRRIWAIIDAEKGGLFRSDDGGEKWTRVNGEHKIRERAWYYSWIYADPKNGDGLYLPNVAFHHSADGGKTFASVKVPHGDNHDLWIDPDDPGRMILGNDGGATITFNGGQTWSAQDNQPTAQFYRVTTDDRFPYWVYGAQQDNSTVAIPSGVPGSGIRRTDWYDVGGGESGWIAPDPRDPEIVYAGGYGGAITRYDHRTRQAREIDPWPQLASGHATSELRYRFQWNAPLLVSRHDPRKLYFAAQKLMRSTDEGETWQEASPDLTRNDPAKQGYSGGPVSHDITGVEVYDTIFTVAESSEKGTLWAGTDDGRVHVTRDDGATWKDVTPREMPAWAQVNSIEVSPHDPATVYLAVTRYKFDDFRPYLFRTTDSGRSWARIDAGIPDSAFTRVVREDTVRRGLLYCGTELGLYVSFDTGASWQPFRRNMPVVPVTDLVQKNDDLVVATQGRAFWILDDVTPLRQWTDAIAKEAVHLFQPRPAYRYPFSGPDEDEEEDEVRPPSIGKNVPPGVLVNYWLDRKPAEKDRLTLEILSGDKVIRTFTNEKKDVEKEKESEAERDEGVSGAEDRDKPKEKPLEPKAGLNRFVWDMRILKPTLVPKAVFDEGEKAPPKVAPGVYRVRLKWNGETRETTAQVRPNPGMHESGPDLARQFELLAAIRDDVSETHETVLKIRDIEDQARAIGAHAEKIGKGDALSLKAKELAQKLRTVEDKLYNPKIRADEDDLNYIPKLDHDFVALAGVVSSADARPTPAEDTYYKELKSRLTAAKAEFQKIVDTDLADFNRAVAEQNIPPVVVPTKVGG
jgi:photosystem II stability/assembly factor-like uncharacterized protein